jgi:nucleoside-diphosphate-sugar epimerase
MKKILITGGAGNVGGSLARQLVLNPDNFVVIVDNLVAFYNRNLRYITRFRKHLFRIAEVLDIRIVIQYSRSGRCRRIVIHNIVILD